MEMMYIIFNDQIYFNSFDQSNIELTNWPEDLTYISNLHHIGHALFNIYFIYVYFAGIILLLALVGAIHLTIELNAKKGKKPNILFTEKKVNFITFYGSSNSL